MFLGFWVEGEFRVEGWVCQEGDYGGSVCCCVVRVVDLGLGLVVVVLPDCVEVGLVILFLFLLFRL